MSVWTVIVLAAAALAVVVVVAVAALGWLALRRCSEGDIPEVLDGIGRLIVSVGRAARQLRAQLMRRQSASGTEELLPVGSDSNDQGGV